MLFIFHSWKYISANFKLILCILNWNGGNIFSKLHLATFVWKLKPPYTIKLVQTTRTVDSHASSGPDSLTSNIFLSSFIREIIILIEKKIGHDNFTFSLRVGLKREHKRELERRIFRESLRECLHCKISNSSKFIFS